MLKLQEPIWSWAAFAVVIPVIIHLWQVKQGRVLKVGSLLLVRAGARQKAWSRRITELWLLLLRCLLILLLAFLLTDPVYINHTPPATKGWILADKRKFQALYNLYKNRIDSLLQQGYELRSFGPGFTSFPVTGITDDRMDGEKENKNYWQLLLQAHHKAPPAVDLYLFTGNDMQRFSSHRPDINRNVHWLTIPDTTVTSVSAAWRLKNGRVKIIQATHTPAATIQKNYEAPPGGTAANITVNNAGTEVKAGHDVFPVDTQVMQITIYTREYPQDAGYLEAALHAISEYNGLNIRVKLINTIQSLPVHSDWLFWLSEDPAPAGTAEHVMMYAKGKIADAASSVRGPGFDEPVALYRIIVSDERTNGGSSLWQDNTGRPVLIADKNEYRIYTHFNPAWNNLVWDAGFPEKIWSLINPQYRVISESIDRRAVDEQQLQFTATSAGKQEQQSTYRLAGLLWLILAGLFAAERWLSMRQVKKGGLR